MTILVLCILGLWGVLYHFTGVKHMMEFKVDELDHSEEDAYCCTVYSPNNKRRFQGLQKQSIHSNSYDLAICFKFFSSCGKQYTELNKKRLKMTK